MSDERDRQIDDQVLAEKDAANHRNVGEDRDMDGCELQARLAKVHSALAELV